jgi:hypothetical protein
MKKTSQILLLHFVLVFAFIQLKAQTLPPKSGYNMSYKSGLSFNANELPTGTTISISVIDAPPFNKSASKVLKTLQYDLQKFGRGVSLPLDDVKVSNVAILVTFNFPSGTDATKTYALNVNRNTNASYGQGGPNPRGCQWEGNLAISVSKNTYRYELLSGNCDGGPGVPGM